MSGATRAEQNARTSVKQRIAIELVLALIVWAVFGRTLGNDFVNYDDQNYVYENPAISSGLDAGSLRWAFTHIHAQNWHPLTTLSHMLDCQLFGLKPAGHHFVNVLLHSGAVVLLFEALLRMTAAPWRSALAAALFAIHPLRVESVAWIAERKDVLSGVFFMLTLLAYVAYSRRQSIARYILLVLAFGCGLLSKPMLVTTPFVLLLLDYWPLRRLRSRSRTAMKLVLEKVPLLLLSVGSCYATLVAQHQYIGSGEELPFQIRVTNALLSYATYIRQLVWPAGLAPFYPHLENRVSLVAIAIALALLTTITAVALALRKRAPYLPVGWFWYLGMLVPVIGIVQVGWQGHADRYTYLPQIGLCVAAVWGMADLTSLPRKLRVILIAATVGVLVAFGVLAFRQTGCWRDSETLWEHTLAVTPNNDVANNNLGILRLNNDRPEEARPYFEAALRFRPDNAVAHMNLGNVMILAGDVEGGIAHLQRAVELDPDNAYASNLLGLAMLQTGRVGDAAAQWTNTLRMHPADGNAMSNLAWIYATSPRADLRDGRKAVQLATQAAAIAKGRNAHVLRILAAAYAEAGEFDQAINTAEQAVKLAQAENNSGLVAELSASIQLYATHQPLRDPSLAQKN